MAKRPSDRYIKFNGEKIHRGRVGAFFESTTAKVAGVYIGLSAISTAFNHRSLVDNLVVTVPASLIGLGVYKAISEPFILRSFSGNIAKTKAIDTDPDDKTPSSLERYGLQAQKAARRSLISISLWAMIPVVALQGNSKDKDIDVSYQFSKWAIIAAGCLSSRRRFHNIAENKWVVVDMPTPEKISEMETAYDEAKKHGQGILVPVPVQS